MHKIHFLGKTAVEFHIILMCQQTVM